MKRVLGMFLIVAVLFCGVAGCSGDGKDGGKKDKSTPPPPPGPKDKPSTPIKPKSVD